MTDWLIFIFFGVALLIGIYFTWILLRIEMRGKPAPRSRRRLWLRPARRPQQTAPTP